MDKMICGEVEHVSSHRSVLPGHELKSNPLALTCETQKQSGALEEVSLGA